jgi:hypothetical protein
MARVAWSTAVLVGTVSATTASVAAASSREEAAVAIAEFFWGLLPAIFAVSGALIVSRQPRNLIGWLLFGPAAAMAVISPLEVRLAGIEAAPPLTVGVFLTLLVVNLSWVLLIFPLLHLLQTFPTGTVLGPRWRWLTWLEIVMVGVIVVAATFASSLGPLDGSWSLESPIGFIPQEFFDGVFAAVWTAGLAVLGVGGVVSAVVRYRRSTVAERRQISLVSYAIAAFAVVYTGLALFGSGEESFPLLLDMVFLASIVAIPVAIAFAIVRRGLFDIDLILRRTLLYTLLTGLLASVYLGLVIVLRGLIGSAIGADSSLRVAVSTLATAALFAPARTRLQRLIDRRLFRGDYDPQQVVEEFARSHRDVTDVPTLTSGLFRVVGSTLHPRSVELWIRNSDPAP